MAGRKYQLKRRAEKQEATRQRIVEAIVELHKSIGPARTTVSAIAEGAGVERLTVYRHFPTEAEQIAACSAHWRALNPPPELARWQAISDPSERLEGALTDLYAYYGRTEPMLSNILRDAPLVAPLQATAAGLSGLLAAARDLLASGWPEHPLILAALGHAVQFDTWRSLVRTQGLDDAQAVAFMARVVRCIAGSGEDRATETAEGNLGEDR